MKPLGYFSQIVGTFAGCKIFYTSQALSIERWQGVALFQVNEPGYISYSICDYRHATVAIFHIKWKGGKK